MMHQPVTPAKDLDSAAAALWAAHPEGPPADVYEPRELMGRTVARTLALETLGTESAMAWFPHLFEPWQGEGAL